MTESDITISEQDQLEAGVRDLLNANGLVSLDASNLDPAWLATHTADELLAALLGAALDACRDGALSAIAAFELPDGGVGYQVLAVRKRTR